MYKRDGMVWPDYATYKLDTKLSNEVNTYKRYNHHQCMTYRIIDVITGSKLERLVKNKQRRYELKK